MEIMSLHDRPENVQPNNTPLSVSELIYKNSENGKKYQTALEVIEKNLSNKYCKCYQISDPDKNGAIHLNMKKKCKLVIHFEPCDCACHTIKEGKDEITIM